MKCPHCNQEHPEGTKYCPYTGKEMPESMLSCPNPDCVNYRKNNLPNDYRFCPICRTELRGRDNAPCDDGVGVDVLPEKKYKIMLLFADERLFPKIDRIAGTDIAGCFNRSWFLSHKQNDFLPRALFEEMVVESKALSIKDQLEAIGAEIELVRLSSSTVEDFRMGHIFINNIVLGKTGLQELLTKKYRKEYEDSLENWMEEDIVRIPFDASEKVHAGVLFLNPDVESNCVAHIQREFDEMFVNPSEANFSFVENANRIVNSIETGFDELPCFAEMGIDDGVFYVDEGTNDRPADEVERIINDILISNGWMKTDNILKSENLFSENDELKATYRCSRADKAGNNVIMMLFVSSESHFGGWPNYRVVFAVNLIK